MRHPGYYEKIYLCVYHLLSYLYYRQKLCINYEHGMKLSLILIKNEKRGGEKCKKCTKTGLLQVKSQCRICGTNAIHRRAESDILLASSA